MSDECVPVSNFIKTLNKIADLVDVDTKDHSRRTKELTIIIAKALGWKGSALQHIEWGADIHDIGKIVISQVVFRQPSKLTAAQFAAVKKHPEFGMDIIHYAALPRIVNECVLHHHEHWDGSGYPFGIKGEDIPMSARIVCIADVWQSITSDRPYRRAMTREIAFDLMEKTQSWFDHAVYLAFVDLYKKGLL